MNSRPEWNNIWKDFVISISRRSPDPKFQVGAVIVTDDNTQVLALGYNGDHKGGPNCRDSMKHGHSGFIHAEVNALIKMDYNNPKRKKMYLTHTPCPVCAKCIINAGINKVYYISDYINMEGIEILSSSNVHIEKLDDN
jgi:dCMP deaminase